MGRALPAPLPKPDKFESLSPKKQAKCLREALGLFVDALQIEGRDPRAPEHHLFQNAVDALGEGNLGQAYEYTFALQNHAAQPIDNVGICGQPLSREDLACGLRDLIDKPVEKKAIQGGHHAAR